MTGYGLKGDEPARWDVAIVLGAGVTRTGAPSRTLERRIRAGIAMIVEGAADNLILTGGGTGPRPEAAAMEEFAMRAGISRDRIHLDPLARNTLENARNAIEIARDRGWTAGIVVTDFYHLPRARLAFRRLGWPVAGLGAGPISVHQIGPAIRELAAFPATLIRLERARRCMRLNGVGEAR